MSAHHGGVGQQQNYFERCMLAAPAEVGDSRSCLVSETGKCTVQRYDTAAESVWLVLAAEAQAATGDSMADLQSPH